MQLYLPPKFKQIVDKKADVSGALNTLMSTFADWLTNNKTEFFPEYTDHGIDHIQSVLNTAEDIIADSAWELMQPEDIYVLSGSIFLHDCAMHLSRDALWDLLTDDTYNGVLLGFDNEEKWADRWNEFISRVNKYDEADTKKLFGDARNFSIPEIGAISLDDNQKIIIGDFVRRYHACIAQVISTYGIPSVKGPRKVFDTKFQYLNQLSGFIARSHNHGLREVVDILGDSRKRQHRDTVPTFLMGILRIADYLQIKADRTPKILFDTIGFCSPISVQEWKKHLAVISTHNTHPDEELLFVETFPEDPSTLVGIKQLLDGLQKELDEFWAVTGEVYSRYAPLNQLQIKYRRVRSNIDNPEKYVTDNHKAYYPEVLSIKTDNQKLFPLLIKPLYGDEPSIGLRELLQNALDACNERYATEQGRDISREHIPYGIEITINLDELTLCISDSGTGMSAKIIKEYFLKIGSSYRTSDSWKESYIQDEKSLAPRTGRFGIGMLAGFLIGHKIEVHTKSPDPKEKSISFDYTLESNAINILYKDKDNIGTDIIIHSTEDTLTQLANDFDREGFSDDTDYYMSLDAWWYIFDSPAISIFTIKNGTSQPIPRNYIITKKDFFTNWNNVKDTNLDGFFWRIKEDKGYEKIYCNGIYIENIAPSHINLNSGLGFCIAPNLEIGFVDGKGLLPLNLTRDDFTIGHFFEIEKLKESFKEFAFKRLKDTVDNYTFSKENILSILSTFKYLFLGENCFCPILFTPNQTLPFSKKHLKNEQHILVDFIYENKKRGLIYDKNINLLEIGLTYSTYLEVEKKFESINAAIDTFVFYKKPMRGLLGRHFLGSYNQDNSYTFNAWIFVKKYDFHKISDYDRSRYKQAKLYTYSINNDWMVICSTENANNIPKQGINICEQVKRKSFLFVIYQPVEIKTPEFARIWEEKIGTQYAVDSEDNEEVIETDD